MEQEKETRCLRCNHSIDEQSVSKAATISIAEHTSYLCAGCVGRYILEGLVGEMMGAVSKQLKTLTKTPSDRRSRDGAAQPPQ